MNRVCLRFLLPIIDVILDIFNREKTEIMKKNFRNRTLASFGLLFIFSGSMLMSQDVCSVLVKELAGSYTGKCRKGLAHGKGKAVGVDSYEGRFSKGLPHGLGTYRWADGSVYDGEWSNGKRDGKGTMTYPVEDGDSVVTGIWEKGVFMGEVTPPPYQVVGMRNVTRYSITKMNDTGSGVRIALYLAGNFNTEIENFSLASNSGEEYQTGRYVGLENAIPPYTVTVRYRSWNSLHSAQYEVFFEFTINETGLFEVSITN
jgi:hypothetical protein